MNWVTAAGFDFTNMAPAEMILSRHVEYLRADTKLKKLFGGSTEDPLKIRCVPVGMSLELGNPPMLFAMIPNADRKPAPGVFLEKVTIRDVIRFHSSTPTGDEPLWESGILTVVSHLIGVVTATSGGANQLKLVNHPVTSLPLATPVTLATRVDLVAVTVIPLEDVQTGNGKNLFDLALDFEYPIAVKVGSPRIWNLAVSGT